MKQDKWNGYGWIKEANKRVWAPFDKEDPLEWILIGFGIGALVVLALVGVADWILQQQYQQQCFYCICITVMMTIINMGEWFIDVYTCLLSIMIVGTVILVLIQHILEGFE